MVMRRAVALLGLFEMMCGVWMLQRTHAVAGTCRLLTAVAAASGVNQACAGTDSVYTEGFVLVASGILIMATALIAIDRRVGLDLRLRFRAVSPKRSTPQRVSTSAPSRSHRVYGARHSAVTRELVPR